MPASAVFHPSVAVGDLVTADLLQSMVPKYYEKPSTQSKTSTTTLADDTDLQGIELEVGTFEIELLLFYTAQTATPNLKTRWGFTGTWNNPDRNIMGPGAGDTGTAANAVGTTNFQGCQAAGQDAVYGIQSNVVFVSARELSMNVVVSAAGNLSLQWAQNVSNANAIRVEGGTCFRVRRIG